MIADDAIDVFADFDAELNVVGLFDVDYLAASFDAVVVAVVAAAAAVVAAAAAAVDGDVVIGSVAADSLEHILEYLGKYVQASHRYQGATH